MCIAPQTYSKSNDIDCWDFRTFLFGRLLNLCTFLYLFVCHNRTPVGTGVQPSNSAKTPQTTGFNPVGTRCSRLSWPGESPQPHTS